MPTNASLLPARSGNETTKQRILKAAEELFSEQSFDAVSMHAIAQRAAVSKANIFHHFGSKNTLYIAVLREACRQLAELLQNLIHASGPLAERLTLFATAHLAHILQRKSVPRLILSELLKGDPLRGEELAQQVFGENFSHLVEILRQGKTEGELRADIDPAMVAALLIGADVFFFQTRDVLRHFPDVDFADDPARYSRMLVDLLLRGILRSNELNQGLKK